MKVRKLAKNRAAYYWVPTERDRARGFSYGPEALGEDYGAALERANALNRFLDAWRSGLGADKNCLDARHGTVGWLFEGYRRSALFQRISDRSKPEYERALRRIEDMTTSDGRTVAELPLRAISTRAVDRLYERLQVGPRGKRVRQANLSIDIARRAWKVMHREHPKEVPYENPFEGTPKLLTKTQKPAATRDEAYKLAYALRDIGEPHLGAAALICFEWLQRPENVLAGEITWSDYRPPGRPNHVRIVHAKTREILWLPLEDEHGLLYPELETYLKS